MNDKSMSLPAEQWKRDHPQMIRRPECDRDRIKELEAQLQAANRDTWVWAKDSKEKEARLLELERELEETRLKVPTTLLQKYEQSQAHNTKLRSDLFSLENRVLELQSGNTRLRDDTQRLEYRLLEKTILLRETLAVLAPLPAQLKVWLAGSGQLERIVALQQRIEEHLR